MNINFDIKYLQIWEIVPKNDSQVDVIYMITRNNTPIPYEDISYTMNKISNEEFSEMIGMQVIQKVKRKNKF